MPLSRAIASGELRWAISNEVFLEYEEIFQRLSSALRWQVLNDLIATTHEHSGTILFIAPTFRFDVISADPDDNKFTDCAIAAEADFVITEDAHFAPLATAGFKPQPITPQEFIARFLRAD